MIKIIRAKDRYFSDFGWLRTYWLFSFSDYFDPTNIQFGALRVFNDDVVLPHTGFPTHPHREMEIVTIVNEGAVTHADSMGNETVIGKGEVQRMSAGTGLLHSEFNRAEEPAHFCQIWIFPDEPGLAPSYDQRRFVTSEWRNRLLPVASGQGLQDVVTFHTDSTIYRADLDHNHALTFKTTDLRRIFLYILKGSLVVNGRHLGHNDQARIDLEHKITITASGDSSFVLIDVPSCKGFGYDKETLAGERRG
jgi:redox-sensitive bicupin YhaK (pirin superfamily)